MSNGEHDYPRVPTRFHGLVVILDEKNEIIAYRCPCVLPCSYEPVDKLSIDGTSEQKECNVLQILHMVSLRWEHKFQTSHAAIVVPEKLRMWLQDLLEIAFHHAIFSLNRRNPQIWFRWDLESSQLMKDPHWLETSSFRRHERPRQVPDISELFRQPGLFNV